jgi:hypothetical protein
MKSSRFGLFVVAAVVTFWLSPAAALQASDPVVTTGSGTGTYYPATGFYSTQGDNDIFGSAIGQGRVETFQVGNTIFWQNFGRTNSKGNGSPFNEVLERTVVDAGTYYTRTKDLGEVVLIPVNDPNFDPAIGPYTAEWTADFELVKGTGIFKGAKADISVTATNDPFLLIDPVWTFTWTFEREFILRR